MTDRELLEKAAKAAGIVLFDGGPDVRVPDECQARVWDRYDQLTILFYSDAGNNPLCKRVRPSGNVEWNPLTDDGDALRLAVKLGLCVDSVIGADVVQFFVTPNPDMVANDTGIRCEDIDITNDDRYAATRRAIVRAAAQIARSGDGSPLGSGARPDEKEQGVSSIVLGAEGEQ